MTDIDVRFVPVEVGVANNERIVEVLTPGKHDVVRRLGLLADRDRAVTGPELWVFYGTKALIGLAAGIDLISDERERGAWIGSLASESPLA